MKKMITAMALLVCGFSAQAQTEKIEAQVLKLLVMNASEIVLIDEDNVKLSGDQQLASLLSNVLNSDVDALNSKKATSIGTMSVYCGKAEIKSEYSCSVGFNFRDLVLKNNSLVNTDYSESSLLLDVDVVSKNGKLELKSKTIKSSIAG